MINFLGAADFKTTKILNSPMFNLQFNLQWKHT